MGGVGGAGVSARVPVGAGELGPPVLLVELTSPLEEAAA